MALHEVEIWNRALSRIGDNRLSLEASVSLTSATAANPVVVTSAAPASAWADDDLVLIRGAVEMTEINGRVFKINQLTTTTFELLEEDGSAYNAETTGGGTIERITNFGNRNAQACFSAWPTVRDEVIEAHPWNNCVRRSRAAREEAARTITGATAANPVRVTCVAHGYTTGDIVLIEGIVGQVELNDRWFIVSQVIIAAVEDPDLFDILAEDGLLHGTYISGGTSKKALTPFTPDSGFGNRFALPADLLRVLELTDSRALWIVENQELHTDEGITAPIRYIFRQLDVTKYRPVLESVLGYRLSLELAEELTQSNTKSEKALAEYELFLERAKSTDSHEQSPKPFQEDDWILTRL